MTATFLDQFRAVLAARGVLAAHVAGPEDRAFIRALVTADVEDTLRHAPAAVRAVMVALHVDGRRAQHARRYPRAQELVVTRGGEPVGTLLADWTHPTTLALLDMAVLPARRGQGTGGEILAAACAAAGDAGRGVRMAVFYDSPARWLLYRAGFRPVAEVGMDVVYGWGG
ncbi:GNAT family N-acetyltransferase [Aerophototrophica crusticola]|uniref:GNAT family N-acetyltransferase n=1 Tax=Aerophototrophica crusticola TaxID=1709002 RepID=A0A858R9L9_9PROT|nr:GNAT family N-acetyltransferase [Rhodospirillaceae bacterium B3]